MELSFNELKKRDVINISDGRCLGRLTNLKLKFPQGILTGIYVPGKKRGLFSCFDKSEIFIEVNKILKIGGDVILVDLRKDAIPRPPEPQPLPPCPPPCNPCVPLCPPQNPNVCAPQNNKPCEKKHSQSGGLSFSDFQDAMNGRYDESDY